jgi:excisionase family DNA binding protein
MTNRGNGSGIVPGPLWCLGERAPNASLVNSTWTFIEVRFTPPFASEHHPRQRRCQSSLCVLGDLNVLIELYSSIGGCTFRSLSARPCFLTICRFCVRARPRATAVSWTRAPGPNARNVIAVMDERAEERTPDTGQDIGAGVFSATAAAEFLGVNERTIRRAIARGELPAVKWGGVYQIAPADLRSYQAQHLIPGAHGASSPRDGPRLIPFPPPHLEPSAAGSLPAPLTSLIGREHEIAAASSLLQREDVRFVTFTGPGGVGKTQLALAVARTLSTTFADGVVIVSLAPISDHAHVASAIAKALDIRDTGAQPLLDSLRTALRNREHLLMLDNFEHVPEAAPIVVDLLTACPLLKVLATSRALLHVSGEHAFQVPPLSLPDPTRSLSVDELIRCDAIDLFVTRARDVNPAFVLTDANAAAVAEICQRLDGLPLALELAAARMRVLSPSSLLEKMTSSLPLLTGGHRDAPERLQTMRNAIAWSYDLLTPGEQLLFRHLSVFLGGFTLEAAQAVMADCFVLDDLSSLVNQSLVRQATLPDDKSRFAMLETIREYGLEQLAASGGENAARDAHAVFFVELDDWLQPRHVPPGERYDDHLLHIEAEHPNLREALAHQADTGNTEGVLRLAGALAVFWHHLGYLPEGRRWLEWALAHTPEAQTAARGRALVGLGLILYSQGDVEPAEPLTRSALAIAEQIGDEELAAACFHNLGHVEYVRGCWELARPLIEEAVCRWRGLGSLSSAAGALNILSELDYEIGDATASALRAEEALALSRATGHSSGAAFALVRLGRLASDRGDVRQATLAYREALQLWSGIGERWANVRALADVAALAAAHHQPETAAVLIGAYDAHLQEIGVSTFPVERGYYDRATASARTALGAEQWAALYGKGCALPLQEAVALALAVSVDDRPVELPGPHRPVPRAGTLTARELQVLHLLVEGLSDKEIAEALGISRRTVSGHVEIILGKFNVPSRTAAATYATRHGLV